MRKFLYTYIIFPSILFAHSPQVDRIHAHILISDPKSACQEAEKALQGNVKDAALWQAYITALAKAGDEKAMVAAWHQYIQIFPDDSENRELLENMAWGVIEEGARSTSPLQRIIAMVAGHSTRDIKGDAILLEKLGDCNTLVRRAALQLAKQHRDPDLADKVLELFHKEKNWQVRLEAINAIGPMRIRGAERELLEILSQKRSRAEEKLAAIQSIANLYDRVDRSQVAQLTRSDRMGLRMLGSYIVRYFNMREEADLVLPLLEDPSPEVRVEALQTLGVLRVSEVNGQNIAAIVKKSLADPEPLVSISSAWLLTLHNHELGRNALVLKLTDSDREVARLASSALASTGKYGLPVLRKAFFDCKDTYAKMNLAIGLISQRIETEAACDALYHALKEDNTRWMWKEKGIFRILCPSEVKHDPGIPNYPEAVNQSARLEILNILAVMSYPEAASAVKQYLQEHQWGITGMASAVLLTEGDEEAVELVKSLIEDPNPRIRTEAAFILALWGREEKAIEVLQSGYSAGDREMREKILEGIGQVGAMASVPFLIETLDDPFPILRMIAASSLLRCLYH